MTVRFRDSDPAYEQRQRQRQAAEAGRADRLAEFRAALERTGRSDLAPPGVEDFPNPIVAVDPDDVAAHVSRVLAETRRQERIATLRDVLAAIETDAGANFVEALRLSIADLEAEGRMRP